MIDPSTVIPGEFVTVANEPAVFYQLVKLAPEVIAEIAEAVVVRLRMEDK